MRIISAFSSTASGELALNEDECAFQQAGGDLSEAMPERGHAVPLCFVLPLARLILPRFRRGYGELGDAGAIRQLLAFGVPAEESDDCELIEVHVFSSFCPFSLGTQKRAAAAPKPRECFLWGTARISFESVSRAGEQ